MKNWKHSILLLGILFLTCTSSLTMKVLIRMVDQQEAFFKNEVVPQFNEKEKQVVEVVHYNSVDSVDFALDQHAGVVGLVKVPFEKSASLVKSGKVLPLENILTGEELREFNETYMLTSLGKIRDKQYYIPRKFETRIMVYLKSKVADAIEVWRKHRDAINAILKEYNGFGLPATFILDDDPNLWDYYDIFVIGWIWAHTAYEGKMGPKVAHRGKRYSGTAQRLIDRIFQCDGEEEAVVSLNGKSVVDAFHWEAVYAAAGIYNDKMWQDAWSGAGVWQGFADGEVFLSFMTQLDCFFIHGTGYEGMKGYLKNTEDMGVAVMPEGCSFILTNKGEVKRKGRKAITTGGWWWGIPKKSPDPKLSYTLARHITNMENQIQGCSRFGMIPVRKDILSDMQMFFGGNWISRIYNVSFKQLMNNKYIVVPQHPQFNEIRNIYLDAWFDIVVNKNWSPDKKVPNRDHIERVLTSNYMPKVDELAKYE